MRLNNNIFAMLTVYKSGTGMLYPSEMTLEAVRLSWSVYLVLPRFMSF